MDSEAEVAALRQVRTALEGLRVLLQRVGGDVKTYAANCNTLGGTDRFTPSCRRRRWSKKRRILRSAGSLALPRRLVHPHAGEGRFLCENVTVAFQSSRLPPLSVRLVLCRLLSSTALVHSLEAQPCMRIVKGLSLSPGPLKAGSAVVRQAASLHL